MSAMKHDRCECGHIWIDHDAEIDACTGCSQCVPKVDTTTHKFVPCSCPSFRLKAAA